MTIREKCNNKPSVAIKAMIEGLETIPNGKFKIDMSVFGGSSNQYNYCYGCAATCTIQQLFAVRFNSTQDIGRPWQRAEILSIHYLDLESFEHAIDKLRRINTIPLLQYFNSRNWFAQLLCWTVKLQELRDDNYKQRLAGYKKLAARLAFFGY